MNAHQHGNDIAARIADLDAWERVKDERLARVGKGGTASAEPYHQMRANAMSAVADVAMSSHPDRENLMWHVGISTTTDQDGNDVPTPVIYIHRTDNSPISDKDRDAAYQLIIRELIRRKLAPVKDANDLIRSRPAATGTEYSIPIRLWSTPPDVKWVRPGVGSATAFDRPVSSRGNWAYTEAHTNPSVGGTHPPQLSSSGASPEVYFHGTEQEFDEFKYDGGARPGVFFSPDVSTAAVYGGSVSMTNEGVDARTPVHWSTVSPSSRVVAARIDTEGMPKLSEADTWLRERGVHPEDDPKVRQITQHRPLGTDEYVEGIVDPFWIRYQSAREAVGDSRMPGPKPRSRDNFWGPVAEHLHHQGAPGIQAPDSLSSSVDRESPEDAEIAVYDPSRVEVVGETRPRYVMMDQDIHNTMSPIRSRAELEIYDSCADTVGDLYEAADDLDVCNQSDGECDDEESAIVEARRAVDECAEGAGDLAGDYRGAARSLGGDPTFDELKTALRDRPMDPAVTDEFRKGLLGDESWPPANYRDPTLAREHLSEALELGYVAPRSEIGSGDAGIKDAVLQFREATPNKPREIPTTGTSFPKGTTQASARSSSGRGRHEMRRL